MNYHGNAQQKSPENKKEQNDKFSAYITCGIPVDIGKGRDSEV